MSCSSVVFPEPELPMIATRSPFATVSCTPRRTSTLRPTSLKVFTSERASSTGTASATSCAAPPRASATAPCVALPRAPTPGSMPALLIAQRLGRRLARRAQRGIERCGNGEREREAADLHDLERPYLRGQVFQVIHLG